MEIKQNTLIMKNDIKTKLLSTKDEIMKAGDIIKYLIDKK